MKANELRIGQKWRNIRYGYSDHILEIVGIDEYYVIYNYKSLKKKYMSKSYFTDDLSRKNHWKKLRDNSNNYEIF